MHRIAICKLAYLTCEISYCTALQYAATFWVQFKGGGLGVLTAGIVLAVWVGLNVIGLTVLVIRYVFGRVSPFKGRFTKAGLKARGARYSYPTAMVLEGSETPTSGAVQSPEIRP